MVSFLVSAFGFQHIETAEDIAQDTLIQAFKNWSFKGIPEKPEAWLFTVARNKALNYLRREKLKSNIFQDLLKQNPDHSYQEEELQHEIEDSMLRMIFACCHPKVSPDNQIVFILKILGGFSRKEIAHALFMEEEAVKKRLFRVKKHIREQNIDLQAPTGVELNNRLKVVCTSLYLLFNEGYNSRHQEELIRKDLCLEAMRLTLILHQHLGDVTSIAALYALMCFHVARFESRLDDNGAIVLLRDQDRSLWNAKLIRAGMFYLSEASKGDDLSAYHLEASIAAQHCLSPNLQETNWKFIQKLYRQLYQLKPSPIILLNLAIVNAYTENIESAITELTRLEREEKKLASYYLLHATLGEFHYELNNSEQSKKYFNKALSLTSSQREKDLIRSKLLRF